MSDRDVLQTALALGQLDPAERAEAERLLTGNPDGVAVTEAISRLADELRRQRRTEPLPRASSSLRNLIAARLAEPTRAVALTLMPDKRSRFRRPALVAGLTASLLLNLGALWYFAAAARAPVADNADQALVATVDANPVIGSRSRTTNEMAVSQDRADTDAASVLIDLREATVAAGDERKPDHDTSVAMVRDLVTHGAQLIGELELALPRERANWNRSAEYLHDLTPVLNQPIAQHSAASYPAAGDSLPTIASRRNVIGVGAISASVQGTSTGPTARFVSARGAPLLLNALQIGDDSVQQAIRELSTGRWPASSSIDVSQFVNRFAQPAADKNRTLKGTQRSRGVSLWSETVVCPWQPAHRLVIVTITTDPASISAIPSNRDSVLHNVVAEVEVNAPRIAAFRTFSSRTALVSATMLRDERSVSVDLPAGASTTTVYELVPATGSSVPLKYQATRQAAQQRPELMTVKVHFTRGDQATAEKRELAVIDDARLVPQAAPVTQRAVTAVAAGLLLRHEATVGALGWRELSRWCQSQEAIAHHPAGRELLALVQLASSLPRPR
ncbi:MAG: DUF3520 domain-containing protein [Planctomycetes bacterium]|nr:DUF3520 domain-containing protein [Planctomycetota bacterium]